MTFTRKYLKSIGLTDEQLDLVMDAHVQVTDALKAERDAAKVDAGDLITVKKQLAEANEKLTGAGNAADVQAQFDAYKLQVETERTNASKRQAVKAAMRAAGVNRDEFIDLLLPKVDLTAVNVAEGGKIADASFIDALKTSYSGCFGVSNANGVNSITPPSGSAKPDYNEMSDEDYYKATYMANKK